MTLHDHGFRTRPAYDLPALARAMADGIGPGGQALDPLMPRYALTTREVEALAAYLGSLGATPPPGITDDAIHLATVVALDASPGGARPCSMCCSTAWPNTARAPAANGARGGCTPGRCTARRPAGRRSWRGICASSRCSRCCPASGGNGRRCTRFARPRACPACFRTPTPGPAPRSSIYLSPGVAVEGRVMARYLEDRPRPRGGWCRCLRRTTSAATAPPRWPPNCPRLRSSTCGPARLPPLAEGDALALWLPSTHCARPWPACRPCRSTVLVSATLGELERRDETGIGATNIRQLRVIHPSTHQGDGWSGWCSTSEAG
jgi:hypothetical protein